MTAHFRRYFGRCLSGRGVEGNLISAVLRRLGPSPYRHAPAAYEATQPDESEAPLHAATHSARRGQWVGSVHAPSRRIESKAERITSRGIGERILRQGRKDVP